LLASAVLLLCAKQSLRAHDQSPRRIIEIVADRDSRYRIDGHPNPVLTLRAAEEITLRITARKARGANRDGSVHGFALPRRGDRVRVPGWDLLLKPGTQDYDLVAPNEAGDYEAVCTVICSDDHEQMRMKVIVTD
jgi:heme/copper-type cytochrome/quinol oxidase subunit 2